MLVAVKVMQKGLSSRLIGFVVLEASSDLLKMK